MVSGLLCFLSRDEGKYIGVEDPDTNEMTLIPLKRIRVRPAVSVVQEACEEEDIQAATTKTRQEQVYKE